MGQRRTPRIPAEYNGIQVNFCHNPNCVNFGVPAKESGKDPKYKKIGVAKNKPAIQCLACRNTTQIKSNEAIHAQLELAIRPPQLSRAVRHVGYSCPNPDCQNFLLKVSHHRKLYRMRGLTSSGNQKCMCKACGKFFTIGSTKRREQVHNFTSSHVGVFKHLVIGTPLRGIEEFYGTTNKETLRKIDLFYERCTLFALEREERISGLDIPRLQLATDKQDYLVNWSRRDDKRTTQLSAIGTADRHSGYVFGMEVNFDGEIQYQDIESDMHYLEDLSIPFPFRKYARVWTPDEFNEDNLGQVRNTKTANPNDEFNLLMQSLDGDRSTDEIHVENQLPKNGVQVHTEYVQYAHFLRLARLLRNVRNIDMYTDLEAGIANAFNLAFQERITRGSARHMLLKFNKGLTVDERRAAVSRTKAMVRDVANTRGYTDEYLAELAIISECMLTPIERDKRGFVGSSNIWYANPIDTIGECGKEVSFVKSQKHLEWAHQVQLIANATLYPIDTFFNQVREKVSYLGRGAASPSSNRRIWNKHSPYNPAQVEKVLQIYRVYRNYCSFRTNSKETPAMRLGLAKGRVDIMDIIG